MIDSQDFAILSEIIFRRERSIPNIEQAHHMSRRQVSYTIKKINCYLEDASVKKILLSGDYVFVDKDSNTFLEQYLIQSQLFVDIYPAKDSRRMMLSLILLSSSEYLSLDHLIITLMSSKSTILNDLKYIRELYTQWSLRLSYSRVRGYFVEGNEERIRHLLMKQVIYFLSQENGEFFLRDVLKRHLEIDYHNIEKTVHQLAIKYEINFFGNTLKEFTFSFILLNSRLKSDRQTMKFEIEFENQKVAESFFSKELCHTRNIHCAQAYQYVTAWVLGLSTGNSQKKTFDRPLILGIVRRLATRFEHLAGIRFLDNESITRRLYEHLRPAYYRLLFHLPIVNPLIQKIKDEYSEMYALVSEAIAPLKPLFKNTIPADEIAYLTVHFAASTFEENEEIVKKNRGIILCPSGIGTSLILLKELETLFPNIELTNREFRDSKSLDEFDIIFTTTITAEILSCPKPFIVVSPILTPNEKYSLIGRVHSLLDNEKVIDPTTRDILRVVEKHVNKTQFSKIESEVMYQLGSREAQVILEERGNLPLLSEITGPDLIKLNIGAKNWEEAIRNATEVLVKTQKVMPSYIDGMIETTRESGPYIVITKHVALPHARPEAGAKEIAISIATLKDPVVFGNKENDPVKYIFGLSALDNQTHLNAMAELADLLDQQAFYQVLDNAESPQEIFNYIKEYEREGK